MSTELRRISELAKANRTLQFTSIAHLLAPGALDRAFRGLRRKASAGVDGLTVAEYEKDAEERIKALHERLRNKTYRAQPLRRVFIPKENGQERPMAIPSLEDKIVQGATVELLEAVYEQDFLPCSYGFRPGRGAQDALDEVGRVICRHPISYVLEIDITSYFDTLDHGHLRSFLDQRIRDGVLRRMIDKWLAAGVLEDGKVHYPRSGSPQGGVVSPILSNIFLHEVLDCWFEDVVKPRLKGHAVLVRYSR
jgi:group II intron reverse transcriptase/maturase